MFFFPDSTGSIGSSFSPNGSKSFFGQALKPSSQSQLEKGDSNLIENLNKMEPTQGVLFDPVESVRNLTSIVPEPEKDVFVSSTLHSKVTQKNKKIFFRSFATRLFRTLNENKKWVHH